MNKLNLKEIFKFEQFLYGNGDNFWCHFYSENLTFTMFNVKVYRKLGRKLALLLNIVYENGIKNLKLKLESKL